MELFSKKLQYRRLLPLICALILVFSLGASLARAEDDDLPETVVTDTETASVPQQEDATAVEPESTPQQKDAMAVEPESSPQQEDATAVEPESTPQQEESVTDLEVDIVPEQETAVADVEPDVEPVPVEEDTESEISDAELERIRLSKCVFTIEEGKIYWMSLTEEELAEYAAYLQEELNLHTSAVAGILTNIQFESGFDPNKIGDDGAAYGICQWRGARLDQMVQFCDENGLSPISLEGQFAFLVHDLKENYIYTYDLVRLVNNSPGGASDATYYFCAYYEVPSDPDAECVDRAEYCDILFYPALLELEEEE